MVVAEVLPLLEAVLVAAELASELLFRVDAGVGDGLGDGETTTVLVAVCCELTVEVVVCPKVIVATGCA